MRSKNFLVLVTALCVLSAASSSWAAIVFFKDGFTLKGKVKRDAVNVDGFTVPTSTYYMDDGARRFLFAQSLLEEGLNRNDPRDEDHVFLLHPVRQRMDQVDPILKVLGTTPVNEKSWQRSITMLNPQGKDTTLQTVAVLSPRYVRFDARMTTWKQYYLTSEMDPDLISRMASNHASMKAVGDKEDGQRRIHYARFLMQAEYFEKAEKELESIIKEYPDVKEKAYELQEGLKQMRLILRSEAVERAWKSGRLAAVRAGLKDFPLEDVDVKIAATLRDIKAKTDTIEETLAAAKTQLADLTKLAKEKHLIEAAARILKELDAQTIDRLGPFLDDVQRAERAVQAGEKPQYDADQLLAIASSGWLMGKTMANPRPEHAEALWRTRNFILSYQRAERHAERQQLLAQFRTESKLELDEIAHMIGFLPPPIPEDIGEQRILELETKIRGTGGRGLKFILQLPPEYHHGRAYPVLFALHDGEDKPRDMIDRLGPLAAEHGYILVAPQWSVHGKQNYQYTAEEHDTVLDVLRDLRYRFQVDSDRVCLTGVGEGGNMALDVGFSHPDVFAGVAPMAANFQFYPDAYDTNCAYLPLYMMNGDQSGKPTKKVIEQFTKKWCKYGYPAILVLYKGRADEWFGGELPSMFDWMNRKKRAALPQEVGRQDREFRSLRPTDNRFYWMASNFINPDRKDDIQRWRNNTPAKFVGKISEGNRISVNVYGMKQLTLWFTRELVDLGKPVQVRVNSSKWTEYKPEVSIETLLEDLFVRGDRQRQFIARLDIQRIP